jgi:transcriptional regulator with XRE-family HTH domain
VPTATERDRILFKLVQLLSEKREAVGLSKNRLAQQAGLSIGAIRFIEDGKRKPSMETLLRIAEALEVDLWKVLKEATDSVKG